MIGQIGVPQALDIARDLHAILAGRDILAAAVSRLPGDIANLVEPQLDQVKGIVDRCTARAGGLLPFLLILVMGRLASPTATTHRASPACPMRSRSRSR
jgi:hypothetical protein